jgi:hypothetical protein
MRLGDGEDVSKCKWGDADRLGSQLAASFISNPYSISPSGPFATFSAFAAMRLKMGVNTGRTAAAVEVSSLPQAGLLNCCQLREGFGRPSRNAPWVCG